MMPIIVPHAILIIDRHYNSLVPYRPPKPSVYAIQHGAAMVFRYASLHGRTIVLRPHQIEHPIELMGIKPGESPGSVVIGRVCASISEV